MTNPGPSRSGSDLADVVEMLLDKGVVINADIAVSIGDTQLLGVHVRAAIASFETAAQYGLAFPEGADSERIAEIAGTPRQGLAPGGDREQGDADGNPEPRSSARHERSAVATRPASDRPGASDAQVVEDDDPTEPDAEDEASDSDDRSDAQAAEAGEADAEDDSESEAADSSDAGADGAGSASDETGEGSGSTAEGES